MSAAGEPKIFTIITSDGQADRLKRVALIKALDRLCPADKARVKRTFPALSTVPTYAEYIAWRKPWN